MNKPWWLDPLTYRGTCGCNAGGMCCCYWDGDDIHHRQDGTVAQSTLNRIRLLQAEVERLRAREQKLVQAIMYPQNHRASTFDFDQWSELCREAGVVGGVDLVAAALAAAEEEND